MAPFALCTNKKCRRIFDYHEEGPDGVPSRVPPRWCPDCGARTLRWCLSCGVSLLRVPTPRAPFCLECGLNLQAIEYDVESKCSTKVGDLNKRP